MRDGNGHENVIKVGIMSLLAYGVNSGDNVPIEHKNCNADVATAVKKWHISLHFHCCRESWTDEGEGCK